MTLGFLGAAVVAPAVAQASVLPTSVTLAGTYTLVHVDGRIGHPAADAYHQEFLTGGHAYDVKLRSGISFRSGDTVSLSGRLDGSTMNVEHSSITAFAPDVPKVASTTRVLVILADWTAPDSVTPAMATNVFAQDNSWFNQTSYGQLSLATTVTGWVHVSAPTTGLCSDSSVADALTSRAVAGSGYNANAFDRVVVYFPSSNDASCTNVAGFAEAPGNHVWLNGTMDTRSTIHEQGHNYGLYHAHSAACTAPGGSPSAGPDAAGDNCTYSDYGDPFDAMGASGLVAEYSASQKNVLGWLGGGRLASLTANTSVALVPYEQQSTAVHAATYQASATRTYWFENRSATGPDSSLPVGATAGVLVHVDDTTVDGAAGEASPWAPQQTYLLDQTPNDSWLGTSVLGYGQSWTSPEGVTFTVGNPSGGTVTVSAVTTGAPLGAVAGLVAPVAASSGATAGSGLASVLSVRLVSGLPTLTVTEGQAVVVSGTALRPDGTGADGATVELQSTPHGRQDWTTVEASTVTGPGFLSAVFRPLGTSDYRLHIATSLTETGSDSNQLTVVVRPVVIAAVTRPSVAPGRAVGLDVLIPGHADQVVTVQRLVHNTWVPYERVRLGTNGRRSVVVRLQVKGHYFYRFAKAADAFHLSAVSKALLVRVS